MQQSTYHNNQFLLMGITIFASITAAVIISTLIIMSLMKGEIASALTSNVQNSTPTAQTASCVMPASESAAGEEGATASAEGSSSAPVAFTSGVRFAHFVPAGSVNNSFNNTSTSTTTNNTTNTEIKTTTIKIKDSFNEDSYNDNSKNPVIVKDNVVNVNSNNGNAINSGNTLNNNSNNTAVTSVSSNTTTNTTNNTAVNSNNVTTTNTAVSTIVENHFLSDNTVVAL